ncbi:MAG: LacI family DNA-binding transcriptional regulator, partial [Angelakisella sp.]
MSNKEYGKITIKEVAKLADISITTVSHYLNGTKSVSAATRSRIKAAITQLDYLPNANAQSLKQQKTHMVGVIIPDMIIYGFICQHIEMFLYEQGYSVIVCNTCFDQTRENMQIKALVQKRVDGIIIASSGGNNDLIRSIHESGIPIILFDRFFEQLPDLNYVLERSDECLTKIVENALRLGHRRMA